MSDRGFAEADQRVMTADAEAVELQDHGTFVVVTKLQQERWEVVVMSDVNKQVIIVVTAYADH